MIVVIGAPLHRPEADAPAADGLACRIAFAVADAGAEVQLVGKVGDDPAGDAVLIALTHAGVGHAALLRDPANPTGVAPPGPVAPGGNDREPEPDDLLDAAELLAVTEASADRPVPLPASGAGLALEAADIELGLRYLVEFGVAVVAQPLDDRMAAVVAEAAAYTGARVVVLVAEGFPASPDLSAATVLEIPPADPDDAFARLVAAYAVALDTGIDPAEAFRSAAELGGWEPALS